jgi:hypothetical protein
LKVDSLPKNSIDDDFDEDDNRKRTLEDKEKNESNFGLNRLIGKKSERNPIQTGPESEMQHVN